MKFENDPTLFCDDGFHPGVDAYAMWADQLVQEALAADGWPGVEKERKIP